MVTDWRAAFQESWDRLTSPCTLAYNRAMPGLTWDHTEDIALSLFETHPDVDPANVRFTDLHKWITDLPNFKDDPLASSEGKLEAIQMAWLEEYQDNQ
jgi:FeS assembly protein IscX